MSALIIAQHDNQTLSDATAKTLSAALALGGDVDILVAGHEAKAVAEAAALLTGVRRIILADAPQLAHQLAEPLAACILAVAEGYDAILAPATSMGKDVMPRVAALLDVMQISDIVGVDGPETFRRTIYAGNAIQTLQSADPVKVITVRASAFPATPEGGAAPVETFVAPEDSGLSEFVDERLSGGDRPELAGARIVVSGGRALGSKEKFEQLLFPLADRLGAALGASRAAVDAGYALNDWQVGQTGKVVAPDLYLAIGISGAIQHLAGMKDAKVIVAINRDEEAPIFQYADYGLVGDLFEILPELQEAL